MAWDAFSRAFCGSIVAYSGHRPGAVASTRAAIMVPSFQSVVKFLIGRSGMLTLSCTGWQASCNVRSSYKRHAWEQKIMEVFIVYAAYPIYTSPVLKGLPYNNNNNNNNNTPAAVTNSRVLPRYYMGNL